MVDCVASNRLLSLGRATVLLSYYYRKAMLDYCSANNRTALTDALMNLVRRIEANSFAIKELVKVSIKNDGTQYFKLSIGLLLRSCLMDSIIGLYLSTQDKESALKIIRNTEHDYVKALPDRFEVYADRDGRYPPEYGLAFWETGFPRPRPVGLPVRGADMRTGTGVGRALWVLR